MVEGQAAPSLESEIYSNAGSFRSVGVTGSPGAGKSTLVAALAGLLRQRGERVGVVAVDPSSPRSGGALLGDRVRMARLDHPDDGLFVRSLASRGGEGGLAEATVATMRVLSWAGYSNIILETVGVGQSETVVESVVDTTVVVVAPGFGDQVQAAKAGLFEVADVLAVTKGDLAGAASVRSELEAMLDLSPPNVRRPEVVMTAGALGEGIEELWDAVLSHRRHLEDTGELAERSRARSERELYQAVRRKLLSSLAELQRTDRWRRSVTSLSEGALSPSRAAKELLEGEG